MEMQTPPASPAAEPDPANAALARTEARQRRHRRWFVVAGIVSLLVGYPLSIGPLELLGAAIGFPPAVQQFLRAVYYPVTWAYDNIEWVKLFYHWYLDFFRI